MNVKQGKQLQVMVKQEPKQEPGARLKAERVQELLRAGWRPVHGATTLRREREFPVTEVASAYASYVAKLGDALQLPVEVRQNGRRLSFLLRIFPRQPLPRSVEDALLNFAAGLG